MGKKSIELLPQTMEILETMGEQIKMARLRRDISAQLVAERAILKSHQVIRMSFGASVNAFLKY